MGSPPSPAQTAPRRRLAARSPATCGARGSGMARPPLHGGSAPAQGRMAPHKHRGAGDALPAAPPQGLYVLCTPDLRARLHLDGAHLLQLLLVDVGELLRQLTLLPLEILQLIDRDLKWGETPSAAAMATLPGGAPRTSAGPPWQTQAAAERSSLATSPPSLLPHGTAATPLLWQSRTPPRASAPTDGSRASLHSRVLAKNVCSVKRRLVFHL